MNYNPITALTVELTWLRYPDHKPEKTNATYLTENEAGETQFMNYWDTGWDKEGVRYWSKVPMSPMSEHRRIVGAQDVVDLSGPILDPVVLSGSVSGRWSSQGAMHELMKRELYESNPVQAWDLKDPTHAEQVTTEPVGGIRYVYVTFGEQHTHDVMGVDFNYQTVAAVPYNYNDQIDQVFKINSLFGPLWLDRFEDNPAVESPDGYPNGTYYLNSLIVAKPEKT